MFEDVNERSRKAGLKRPLHLPGWVTLKMFGAFLNSDILFMPSFSKDSPVVGGAGTRQRACHCRQQHRADFWI